MSRRPYRVHLPARGRRQSFTTLERAVSACCELDGMYVVEHRADGIYLPHTGVIVRSGAVKWRTDWEHLRSVPERQPA